MFSKTKANNLIGSGGFDSRHTHYFVNGSIEILYAVVDWMFL